MKSELEKVGKFVSPKSENYRNANNARKRNRLSVAFCLVRIGQHL